MNQTTQRTMRLKPNILPGPQWDLWKEQRIKATRDVLDAYRIDLVIDAGAHQGLWSRWLKRCLGYQGYIESFEPVEESFDFLWKTAKTLDPERWRCHMLALGVISGEAEMFVAENREMSSLFPPTEFGLKHFPAGKTQRRQRVVVAALDDCFDKLTEGREAVFLKVDAEGGTMDVLRGAEESLNEIAAVQVELSMVQVYEGQTDYLETIDWMRRRGFELSAMLPVCSDSGNLRMVEADALFCRMGD